MKPLYIVLGVVAVIGLFIAGSANGLVRSDEYVSSTYSDIQNATQNASDKIGNLVEVVKGYAKHESGTFTQVAEARAQVAAISKIDPTKIANDPELQKKLIEAQANMSQAMVKLNSVTENYPNLKADRMFTDLMSEISGSANRIKQARKVNIQAVKDYNVSIRVFPRSIIASSLGYTKKPYFEAAADAQNMPTVKPF